MRPSGKITRRSPLFTRLISWRVASGLVGSIGKARTSFRNGRTHQRVAICELMAKTGSSTSSDMMSGASSRLVWLTAITAFLGASVRFSMPFTSTRNSVDMMRCTVSNSIDPGSTNPISGEPIRQTTPTIAISSGVVAPADWASISSTVPPTMKAAFSTLLAAMTRARRPSPASACRKAKTGTANRPPEAARPTRSIITRQFEGSDAKPIQPTGMTGFSASQVASARSSAKTPVRMPPIGVSTSRMRWCESFAAVSEPAAMPMVNSAMNNVARLSLPPSVSAASTGIRTVMIAPIIQKPEIATAEIQSFGFWRSSPSSEKVDLNRLSSMTRSGARLPVGGICVAQAQDSTETPMVTAAIAQGLASATMTPPITVPVRMARKVAVSTSALPETSSSRFRWSGRMPYFTGPNRAESTPVRNSATNRSVAECVTKPAAAMTATPISANFRRLATTALSKRSAIWPPSAETMKNGRMKSAVASVTSWCPSSPPIL